MTVYILLHVLRIYLIFFPLLPGHRKYFIYCWGDTPTIRRWFPCTHVIKATYKTFIQNFRRTIWHAREEYPTYSPGGGGDMRADCAIVPELQIFHSKC